jgi:hypothetical protein
MLSEANVITELHTAVKGRVITPDDTEYDRARPR